VGAESLEEKKLKSKKIQRKVLHVLVMEKSRGERLLGSESANSSDPTHGGTKQHVQIG